MCSADTRTLCDRLRATADRFPADGVFRSVREPGGPAASGEARAHLIAFHFTGPCGLGAASAPRDSSATATLSRSDSVGRHSSQAGRALVRPWRAFGIEPAICARTVTSPGNPSQDSERPIRDTEGCA